MRRKLVAGNWKMHGGLVANQHLLEGVVAGLATGCQAEVAVCVPFPYLGQVQALLDGSVIRWGAQNLSAHAEGAFTGEVSAGMLQDFSCAYTIVGHSERRSLFGETDSVVAAKFAAATSAGLLPILCVGESLADREMGRAAPVVLEQLEAVLQLPGASAAFVGAVVAYEPVWAIGTGRTASPAQVQEMHLVIREFLGRQGVDVKAARILYGGSVKASNARELFDLPDVDGALVGGASLVVEDFLAICRAVA